MVDKALTTEMLKQQLIDSLMTAAIGHVGEWIHTLGSSGSMKNKKINPAARVTAAKTGIDLVTKLVTMGGASYTGEALLDELAALETTPPMTDDAYADYNPDNDDADESD